MVAQRQRGEPHRPHPAFGVIPEAARVVRSSSDTPTASSMSAVSSSVSARSGARISDSSPCMRRRPSRSGGSARVAITTRSCRRRAVQQLVEIDVDDLADLVEVVEHEHERLVAALHRLGEPGDQALDPRRRMRGERGRPPRRHRRGSAPRARRARTAGGRRRRRPATARRRRRAPAARDPAREQRRLAGARRRREQRQRALDPRVERPQQAAAHDDARLIVRAARTWSPGRAATADRAHSTSHRLSGAIDETSTYSRSVACAAASAHWSGFPVDVELRERSVAE